LQQAANGKRNTYHQDKKNPTGQPMKMSNKNHIIADSNPEIPLIVK